MNLSAMNHLKVFEARANLSAAKMYPKQFSFREYVTYCDIFRDY